MNMKLIEQNNNVETKTMLPTGQHKPNNQTLHQTFNKHKQHPYKKQIQLCKELNVLAKGSIITETKEWTQTLEEVNELVYNDYFLTPTETRQQYYQEILQQHQIQILPIQSKTAN